MEFPLFLNEGEESAWDSAGVATKEATAWRVCCPPPHIPAAGEAWGAQFRTSGNLVKSKGRLAGLRALVFPRPTLDCSLGEGREPGKPLRKGTERVAGKKKN